MINVYFSSRAVVELLPYLMDSFGNSTRIDYGTGHEMAFVMLLCCLFRMEGLQQTDRAAVSQTLPKIKVTKTFRLASKSLAAT